MMKDLALHPHSPNDRGLLMYPELQNITQIQEFEDGDPNHRDTASLNNQGVGVVPSPQDTIPNLRGKELPHHPIDPSASTQSDPNLANQTVNGVERSIPISPERPEGLLGIDEWVSELSQVANRDGTTYEAVKGLGVPNHLRQAIFAALTPQVTERLKDLREEFERRILKDIQKWREAIATWSVLDAETLNTQWQQFDLWSQCLLGIGNWVENIAQSGLFDLAATRYSEAIELGTGEASALVDMEVTNAEPQQLNLLPDIQPSLESDNRFSSESEDWL